MRTTRTIMTILLVGAIGACGSDKKSKSSNSGGETQTDTAKKKDQDAEVIVAKPDAGVTRASDPYASFEDPETKNKADYSAADSYGARYNPSASVGYDQRYNQPQMSSQGNAYSEQYFGQLNGYSSQLSRPYSNYQSQVQRPYLGDRYNQHRCFLNQRRTFNDVSVGRGPWTQARHHHVSQGFDRSQTWVNYDVYNLIYRTLQNLKSQNRHSSRGLEAKIHDCIRRRDHQSAVRYHDELLDEMNPGRGERADSRGPGRGQPGGHGRS